MSQMDLFPQPSPVISSIPSVDAVRARLAAMLARLRAATLNPPFTARELAYWEVVTPQMANWLPQDERDEICAEFSEHISRLSKLAA
jgi:hypothetical protein